MGLSADQATGAMLLAAVFAPWLIPAFGPPLVRCIDTAIRNHGVRHQRAMARATTTYWLGSQQITRADFDAIASRDAQARPTSGGVV